MTRAHRQVDNIRDCGDNDRSTFFQEPGGTKSDCLLGLLNKILETSDSGVGLKTEKSGGATGGEGECGEVEEELLASERRSLDILSVKKEAIEVAADEEGKGEADLRFKNLFTVCQICRGLSDDEETSLEKYCFWNQG